jgi:outer membrane protein assembly factor BamB
MLATDTVAVLDPVKEQVRWAQQGPFRRQHEPTLRDDGRIVLFDNEAGPDQSRVLALDVETREVVWRWDGGPWGLYSRRCGAVHVLPGGHVLVVESEGGRAFEITPEGDVVWAWSSPHRAGPKKRLVATLFDVVRVPEVPSWLSP